MKALAALLVLATAGAVSVWVVATAVGPAFTADAPPVGVLHALSAGWLVCAWAGAGGWAWNEWSES